MEITTMVNGTKKPVSALTLIREFFKIEGQSIAQFGVEYRALTETDKLELASAIATQKGLQLDDLAFLPVNY
jgi:hypothetical protein